MLPSVNLFTLMKRYLAAQPTQSTEATVFAIDGMRVDIRLAGSATLLRNVQVMGDPTALEIGQAVPLLWDNNTPIVLALTSDGSVPVAATVVTDNITIENSTFGLRVKPGGVQPWHLSFVPSIEGHTHQDMLQMAGWRINASGAIFKGDTYIYDDGQISLGSGEQVIVLDALDLRYRMYSGASDPTLAPFAILADGSMRATAGTIGGWEIFSNRLSNNNIWLDPAGWIKIGFTGITGQNDDNAIYMTSTTDTAWEEDWAFWIGAEYPEDAPFRVTKGGSTWMTDAYIAVNLQSDNYVAGQSGWKLDPQGTLEAQNAIIRGEIHSSVFISGTTTVTSGKQVVSDATVFLNDVGSTDETIDVNEASFEVDDMVLVQPDLSRMEWMRITGGPIVIAGGFQYEVLRDLDGTGPNDFYVGENVHREGGATYPDPAPLWGDIQGPLGFEGPWGGPGFKAMGGFLIYDGSRDSGPYFAVRRRFGASWNQMSDVVRIGRLKGFLGYEIDEYGFGVGSLDSNMFFTQRDGMSLVMGNGQTSINADGVASERFGLFFAEDEPGYTDQMVRFWVDPVTKRVYANYKDGAFEEEAVWLDFTSGGSISDNSDMVDGIHASASPTANYLLPLNASGLFDASITGDADTLDTYHASSFSLSDHTHGEGGWLTEEEADLLYLSLAGGTLTGQLDMTDAVKIGFGSSYLQGNSSLGRIDMVGTSRLRMLIGVDPHIEIESGQIYLNRTANVMGGYDLIVYSDAGTTEVARIDGATGTYNGVDVGALDNDDGADIIGYRDGYSVGWTMDRMATMVMLTIPSVNVETGLNLNWGEGTFLAAGSIYDTLGSEAALTDDDVNYLVWGESTDTSELTIVLTHDPDTQILVAEIVCVSGVGTVTMAPTLNLLARDAWYLARNSTCTVSGTTGNLVSIATDGTLEDSAYDPTDFAASSHDHDDLYYTETELQTSGQSSVHWDNITDAPSPGGEWTLDTSNYLFPNSETTQVVIGATSGSGSEILQVTGDTILSGNLTISGGTIDLGGNPITAVSAQVYLSAAGGIPKTTAGCSAPTQIEFATNDQNFYVLDFDSTTQEHADWAFVLPSDYDGGAMAATFVWKEKSGATSHDVLWGIRGVCYANDDPFDVAEGTAVEVTASAGNALDVYFSDPTEDITWAGTPAGGQLIHITVYRDPADTSDTLNTDARLLGVQLTYTRA